MHEGLAEPSARILCRAQVHSSLESVCDEIVDEQASTSLSSVPVGAALQTERYLRETTSSQEDNPALYWWVNKVHFLNLV